MAVRSSASLLDRRVLRRAVPVTLLLAVPPVVIVRVVTGVYLAGRESNLWLVAIAVMLVAFLIGGAVAAASSRDLQLSHSAGSATYSFFVIGIGSIVVALATGSHIDTAFVLGLAMIGAVCVCAAVIGGYGTLRWTERGK